jgi:hypothetical protein
MFNLAVKYSSSVHDAILSKYVQYCTLKTNWNLICCAEFSFKTLVWRRKLQVLPEFASYFRENISAKN